jgi:hypothetical protein
METNPSITIDLPTLMTLGFYLLALLYVIFSVIFYYHWMQYAVDKRVRSVSLSLYIFTTLPLITIMGLMIFLE